MQEPTTSKLESCMSFLFCFVFCFTCFVKSKQSVSQLSPIQGALTQCCYVCNTNFFCIFESQSCMLFMCMKIYFNFNLIYRHCSYSYLCSVHLYVQHLCLTRTFLYLECLNERSTAFLLWNIAKVHSIYWTFFESDYPKLGLSCPHYQMF